MGDGRGRRVVITSVARRRGRRGAGGAGKLGCTCTALTRNLFPGRPFFLHEQLRVTQTPIDVAHRIAGHTTPRLTLKHKALYSGCSFCWSDLGRKLAIEDVEVETELRLGW